MTKGRGVGVVGAFVVAAAFGALATGCGSDEVDDDEAFDSLAIAPSSATLQPGETAELSAVVTHADGSHETATDAVWASSDEAVATVAASGVVTGVHSGNATVTATARGLDATAEIQVVFEVQLQVTPATADLICGGTQQFTATVIQESGPVDATEAVTWSASPEGVVTIDEHGLATGVDIGDATITATLDTVDATAAAAVTCPVAAIEVTPAATQITTCGGTQQFSARAVRVDGSNVDVTEEAVWSSSVPSVATIDDGGLASAVDAGETVITAAWMDVTGTADLYVAGGDPIALALTPAEATLAVGDSIALTATVHLSDGCDLDATDSVEWSSGDDGIATVSDIGVVQGVAQGSTSITAQFPELTAATMDVTVE